MRRRTAAALNALEGPLPESMKPLVTELLNLDRALSTWCEKTQQKVAYAPANNVGIESSILQR